MPLNQPLAELRRNLEAQIREGQLPEALDALLAEFSEFSETYRIVSALIARLNSAKKERSRFTISVEEYMRLESQVSADLLDLVARLKEKDFSPTSTHEEAEISTNNKGKFGTVLYRVPHLMTLQEITECIIRVAVDEASIRKGLDIDDNVEIKTQVEISDVMRAEIVDPEGETFKIISHNAANQLVRDTGITEWQFSVMPLRLGVHKLQVKVSIMEIVPGFPEPILRDVSVMETVTVVAKTSVAAPGSAVVAPKVEEISDYKLSDQIFAFQSTSTTHENYEINNSKSVEIQPEPSVPTSSNRSLRAVALFLAFLVIVPAATFAIVPDFPAYVVAIVRDTPEAYTDFIENHPNSPRLEKAYFYRAEASGQLADLRAYQEKFQNKGKFESKVLGRIAALETKSLEGIREQPDSLKIRNFVTVFPESERLAEVKQAVEARQENRQKLLAEVEDAYVSSVKAKPTETKVVAYLRDFPRQERLDEVDAAARSKPEVFQKVQPILEDAYLKKMEDNPTQMQSEQFIQKFPEPVRREKLEKILEKKPELKKEAVKKMRKLEEAKKTKVEVRSGSVEIPLSGKSEALKPGFQYQGDCFPYIKRNQMTTKGRVVETSFLKILERVNYSYTLQFIYSEKGIVGSIVSNAAAPLNLNDEIEFVIDNNPSLKFKFISITERLNAEPLVLRNTFNVSPDELELLANVSIKSFYIKDLKHKKIYKYEIQAVIKEELKNMIFCMRKNI